MNLLKAFVLAAVALTVPLAAFAIGCAELSSDAKIKAFIRKSNNSNPMFRDNTSVMLDLSPCEGADCQNKRKRARLKETVYSVKMKERNRVFFVRGPNAMQCMVERGKRQFWCSRCGWSSNEQCRSYKVSEASTVVRGTNIDRSDMEQILDNNHKSKCFNLKKQPKFLKIVTEKTGGDSPYDKIISFYQKKKKYVVTVNLFSKKILRKVYRFFPKYHVKIDGNWIATVVRVRTTQGKEKSYLFETLVSVNRDQDGKYMLYTELKKDPRLSSANVNFLFNTE